MSSSLLLSSQRIVTAAGVQTRFRSTKGSYRVRNRTKATKLEHERNRADRDVMKKEHRDRMIIQRKDAVERKMDRQLQHTKLLASHQETIGDSAVVRLTNIPFDVDEQKLLSLFKSQQPVKAVVARTKIAHKSRGVAYLFLQSAESAKSFVESTPTVEIAGRVAEVKRAAEKYAIVE